MTALEDLCGYFEPTLGNLPAAEKITGREISKDFCEKLWLIRNLQKNAKNNKNKNAATFKNMIVNFFKGKMAHKFFTSRNGRQI